MLEKLGYDVEIAKNGEEAIRLYKEAKEKGQSFDAVIMDLIIKGGMGGKKASEEILKYDPEAKIIISSGYFNDPIMSEYKKYKFKGVIAKPYKVDKLSFVLHRVLKETNS